MKKRYILIIIAVLILIVIFVVRKRNGGTVEVRKVEIEEIVVRRTVSASGTVTSEHVADLALTGIGQLQSLLVEKGQYITKGKVIGNIYNYDSSQTAQAAKDHRDVAKHDVDIYIEDYLTNYGAAGGRDEYNLNLKRLRELLSKAEASYQSSLGTLSKTILTSPFSGTVIDVYADVGEVTAAGSSIVKIADLDNLLFEISVDQEDFGLLKIGQEVEITLDSYDDMQFMAMVLEIPQYADEETDEFTIKLKFIKSEELPILLGMNGDASIIIAESENSTSALTFDAIVSKNGDNYVWIDSGGKLKKEIVAIGLEGDIYTEVLTDLTNQTIVIPIEDNKSDEGAKVKYED